MNASTAVTGVPANECVTIVRFQPKCPTISTTACDIDSIATDDLQLPPRPSAPEICASIGTSSSPSLLIIITICRKFVDRRSYQNIARIVPKAAAPCENSDSSSEFAWRIIAFHPTPPVVVAAPL